MVMVTQLCKFTKYKLNQLWYVNYTLGKLLKGEREREREQSDADGVDNDI